MGLGRGDSLTTSRQRPQARGIADHEAQEKTRWEVVAWPSARGAGPGEPPAGMCPMSSEAVRPDVLAPAEFLRVLLAVKDGDFGARMPVDLTGLTGKVADTLNEVIRLNESLARELARIGTVVG